MKITIKEAYDAMFYFLDKYYDTKMIDDLGAMLGSMNPSLFCDDMPADMALWNKWVEISTNEMENEGLDSNKAFQAMVTFLNYYNEEFGARIEEVIEDLVVNIIDNKEMKIMWKESIEQALDSFK